MLGARVNVCIALHQQQSTAQASVARQMKSPQTPGSASTHKTLLLQAHVRNLSLAMREHWPAADSAHAGAHSSTHRDRHIEQQQQQHAHEHEYEHQLLEIPDFEARASLHVIAHDMHAGSHANGHTQASIPVPPLPGVAEGQVGACTGLEVEAQLRSRTVVAARVSMPDVHQLLSISEAAAAEIALLVLLAARLAPPDPSPSTAACAGAGQAASSIGHAGDSLGAAPATAAAMRSTSAASPWLECAAIDWAAVALDCVRHCSFKADGLRVVFLECRQGGALGQIRLPLLACRLETVECIGHQQLPCSRAVLPHADEAAGEEVVSASVNASVDVSYFNRSLAVWEPLFERCSMGVQATLSTTLRQVVAGAKPKLAVRVSGKEVLNVNISTALVDLLATAVKHGSTQLPGRDHLAATTSAASSATSQPKSSGSAFHPLWVRNQVGHAVMLRCGQQQQQVGLGTKTPVTCVPLVQSGGLLDGLPMLAASSVVLELALEDAGGAGAAVAHVTGTVKLDVLGRQVLTLSVPQPVAKGVLPIHDVKVVVDVMVEEGGASKLILMQSPLIICNQLNIPLEIMFADTQPGQGPTMAGRTRTIIGAQASLMVPVLHIDNKDGFSVRPYSSPVQSAASAPGPEAAGGAGWAGKHGTKHPGYRWRTGESLMCREWRPRRQLTHFKALGMHGLPLSAVMQWDTDTACTAAQTPRTLWRLLLHPALTIENVLPCAMSVRITTSLECDPPSPRGPAGALWSIDIASGASCPVHDRQMTAGTHMWLSVKMPNFSWSQPVLLRDGRLSAEAAATGPPPIPHAGSV